MSTVSFTGLLAISAIAVAAPILAASVKRVNLPSAVVEIAAGIIVGPSILAWVKIDQPINVVALLGLAFLLFLAGLEIDLRAMTPGGSALHSRALPARCCSGPSRAPASTRWDGSAIRPSSPSRWRPRPPGSSSPSSKTRANRKPFWAS
ncbi:MAG: cation:proton antiporter [Streptosporangiaceae bacterium]